VSAKPDTDSEMQARLTKLEKELELLKKEKDSVVEALKRQLVVRNISTYKIFITDISWERQLESFSVTLLHIHPVRDVLIFISRPIYMI
jgi:hypothetical protein